jgi:hypothetical protein
MLEIIALVFLTRNIGELAIQKGLKPGAWKLYTVLAWFGAEILGFILGFAMGGEDGFGFAFLFGLSFAVASYFIVKANLSKRPDHFNDDINSIGVSDLYPQKSAKQ